MKKTMLLTALFSLALSFFALGYNQVATQDAQAQLLLDEAQAF